MLAFANLVALHGDGKAPLSYAENSLIVAKAANFAVKQVTGLQEANTKQTIVQLWISDAGGGQGKRAEAWCRGSIGKVVARFCLKPKVGRRKSAPSQCAWCRWFRLG